jgi:MerR family mercuric resistance operon transcriptional regulator
MPRVLQIGQAAKATGLSVDTIRFYQKCGLVRPPARTTGGFRIFNATDLEELQFIARAQELGFSLAEIKDLVSVQQQNGRGCLEVQALLKRKLAVVRGKISGLRQIEVELDRALRRCDRALKDSTNVPACPVIDQIQRASKRRKP